MEEKHRRVAFTHLEVTQTTAAHIDKHRLDLLDRFPRFGRLSELRLKRFDEPVYLRIGNGLIR